MLSKRERVLVHLLTQAADVVPDVVLYLRQLGLRLLGHLDDVVGGVDVSLANNQGRFVIVQLSDDRPGNW